MKTLMRLIKVLDFHSLTLALLYRVMGSMMERLHPSYVTTYWSIGGAKAVLMKWNAEGDFYEPFMTGPGCKTMKDADAWGEDWAKAEGIEFKRWW